MARLLRTAKNLLFAASLAANAYTLYAVYEALRFARDTSLHYAVDVAQSCAQLYRRTEELLDDQQFKRDLTRFKNAWQEYQAHKPDVDRDLHRLEKRLGILFPDYTLNPAEKPGLPAQDTPSPE